MRCPPIACVCSETTNKCLLETNFWIYTKQDNLFVGSPVLIFLLLHSESFRSYAFFWLLAILRMRSSFSEWENKLDEEKKERIIDARFRIHRWLFRVKQKACTRFVRHTVHAMISRRYHLYRMNIANKFNVSMETICINR